MTSIRVKSDDVFADGTIFLDESSSHHLKTVLRIRLGEKIKLIDGVGHKRTVVVDKIEKSRVVCFPDGDAEHFSEPERKVILFQCVAKHVGMDWLIEKAVEIGTAEIVPIVSAHSVVRITPGVRQERWEKIADSALCQCAGAWATRISVPLTWKQAVERMKETNAFIGVTHNSSLRLLDAVLKADVETNKNIGWIVGPEGDFSETEIDSAVNDANATPVTLGNRIMRTETAAVYGLSVITSTSVLFSNRGI